MRRVIINPNEQVALFCLYCGEFIEIILTIVQLILQKLQSITTITGSPSARQAQVQTMNMPFLRRAVFISNCSFHPRIQQNPIGG